MSAEAKTFQHQFTEFWAGHTGLTFGIERVLFSEQSDFQQVTVVQTDTFGRLMLLDGLVMLTERDEFVYHEMIAHPALCLHPKVRRVLVIGGGDGGTVREVLRHPDVQHVDLVEIDGLVVEAARRFFPTVACALDDPRLDVRIEDGLAFIKNAPEGSYDVVLVDSTDPVGFAEGLFGEDFYRDCVRVLGPNGILVSQTESPFDEAFQRQIRSAGRTLGGLFTHVAFYLAHIPTYPMGTWSFVMASKGPHPVADFDEAAARARLAPFADALKYYHAGLHRAAFALPAFVERLF
ncbi:MAG TPA: polyamine aminopropyltransferase [Rhodothermales bacterium]|nr:polyamine aminopropyltransferase [Rhodothermales bacterium]